MRIAVINVSARRNETKDYTKALADGMESMGHRVEILEVEDGYKLPGYEYIAICAEPASFWGGKMPDTLPKLLASASNLTGKKGAAFLKKTGPFFVNKALCNLMKAMEKEGMMVNWSEVLLSSDHANAMGKRIGA
jgi:hypothetical protein